MYLSELESRDTDDIANISCDRKMEEGSFKANKIADLVIRRLILRGLALSRSVEYCTMYQFKIHDTFEN